MKPPWMFSAVVDFLTAILVSFLILDICVLCGAAISGSKEGASGGICCTAAW
jgi:hypothetical protein